MKHIRTFSRALLLSCSALAWSGAAHADEVRKGIVVKIDAEADKNPYLGVYGPTTNSTSTDNPDWVGVGSIQITPWVSARDERNSIRLSAFARGRAYTSRYKFDDSYGANLAVSSRASQYTTFSGRANVLSTRSNGGYDYIGRLPSVFQDTSGSTTPVDTVTVPPALQPGQDITLLGFTGRSTSIDVSAQGATQTSARTSFNADVGYQKLIVSGAGSTAFGNADYDSASAGLGYMHRVSANTQVGIRATGRYTRYQNIYPNATTLGLSASLDTQLSQFWHLAATVGVSGTNSQANALFPSYSSVTAAGSLSLCNRNSRRNFCLTYDRSQQPSALGRIRNTDSVSVDYGQTLSDVDKFSLRASYSRSKGADPSLTNYPNVELASFSSTFTHSFSRRIDGYVFGSLDRTYGGFVNDKPRIAIGVGLTVRIGDQS